jgi:hypothetical protein
VKDARHLSPGARFAVVGSAVGATEADRRYFQDRPRETDRIRPVEPGELEDPQGLITHVRVFEHISFNGDRTGIRHRQLLRIAQAERAADRSEDRA